MQFLAQVMPPDLGPAAGGCAWSVYMCQNNPGLCEEWDAAAGANQALVFAADDLMPAAVPEGKAVLLAEVSAAEFVTMEGGYDQARQSWPDRAGRPHRDILGQIGGQPSWVQYDETPACQGCGEPMSFVVQLEEGHDHSTSANFGGGCGYGFACWPCRKGAFCWQQ